MASSPLSSALIVGIVAYPATFLFTLAEVALEAKDGLRLRRESVLLLVRAIRWRFNFNFLLVT